MTRRSTPRTSGASAGGGFQASPSPPAAVRGQTVASRQRPGIAPLKIIFLAIDSDGATLPIKPRSTFTNLSVQTVTADARRLYYFMCRNINPPSVNPDTTLLGLKNLVERHAMKRMRLEAEAVGKGAARSLSKRRRITNPIRMNEPVILLEER